MEVLDNLVGIGTCPGHWQATHESCLKLYIEGSRLSGMCTIHPEEFDQLISLAMLRDYLA